ncbi:MULTISPECIES: DUF2076 domain-containing protein [Rhodopseudomonas]|uniref:ABC transporter substrate-binding protein n=1 Tax=Rhodopseudomonas palustris TaxID=1076 RepID=A0A0D7ENX9_RHOPL|nr:MULTISPECIES: DUF2076 domain-containing protein [Rhodopseudomonas]KIZ42240.1 ABC transporter substrate-binding protein [Rhodopseudomonas palustris]MDF3811117.1 DUF2076 domain-containing protein [Rhodopseudomonas sp. BAL398]WOK17418.1 DUF2076 domain-containing protein [Rhodopseudomonas sp. BAL398]
MTPQERQLVDDLFERLAHVETAPRDPDATAAITQGLRTAPNATYALVQTVLLQDEALKRAHDRIQQLEGTDEPQQERGGFLDSMRETIFGRDQSQPRGSVPNVRPPDLGSRPAWNTGQVLGSTQGQYNPRQDRPYAEPQGGPYGQPQPGSYGAPPAANGGGSFLGTAAAAAAGMVGGSLLLGSIRSMMGGTQHGFGDQSALGGGIQNPWAGDQSGGSLARDAGLNDIGNTNDPSGLRADDPSSRQGMFDQASNEDHDDMDLDGNDFDDGGGDSDFA